MNTEKKGKAKREETENRGKREKRDTNLICKVSINMNEVKKDEIQLLFYR